MSNLLFYQVSTFPLNLYQLIIKQQIRQIHLLLIIMKRILYKIYSQTLNLKMLYNMRHLNIINYHPFPIVLINIRDHNYFILNIYYSLHFLLSNLNEYYAFPIHINLYRLISFIHFILLYKMNMQLLKISKLDQHIQQFQKDYSYK